MDAFGLVERGLFGQAIIEQRGAGRLVPRDPGGDLEVAAVSQLLGDPRAAEAVGANLGGEARLLGATLDHLERTQAQHYPILERIAPALLVEAEEPAGALGVVVGDAKRDRDAHRLSVIVDFRGGCSRTAMPNTIALPNSRSR